MNEIRKEIADELRALTMEDLIKEAAVNSRVAVRVLYRNLEPRIAKLETRAQVFVGILTIASIVGPIVAAVLGYTLGRF